MRRPCWFQSCHFPAVCLAHDTLTGRLIPMCREHVREFMGLSGGSNSNHAL